MKDELTQLIRSRQASPFLFLGSGFSRRYVGLEDWRGLLSRFCATDRPFEYYLASADGNVPRAAALLARDFNERWWTSSEFKDSVERDRSKVVDSTSALRLEIARYLSTLDQSKAKLSEYAEEFELLAGLNVDGIITTNWDLLLEQIFPGYKVYVGQKELLFSNVQQIGEIYKIHGCSTKPTSLVLTDADYREFNERNAYLAAKLITIFVEHPIIFIGYSLSDENITSLLRAISLCIGAEQIEKLRSNLIFVQRLRAEDKEGVASTYIAIDGVQIPLILIRTNDFRPVYQALGDVKRKIPARILRYCKEQLYELVSSTEPEDRLCVVDIDEIDRHEDVEFIVGVGVVSRERAKDAEQVGELGYAAIEADDLFHDLLHDDRHYNAPSVLESVIRRAGKNTKNVPVFKYLHAGGIHGLAEYEERSLALDKWVRRDLKEFQIKGYLQAYFKLRHLPMSELIKASTVQNASAYIPCIPKEKIDLDLLREFLLSNEEKLYTKGPYQSNFRKLATLYDKLKWGW